MKIFFIALILGIFIGALSMSYYKTPGAFIGLSPETHVADESEIPALSPKEETPIESTAKNILEDASTEEEIIPATETLNDRRQDLLIGSQVQSALLLEESIAALNLKAQVSSGKVTLQGTAPDEETKQKAISTIANIPLVVEVIDEINVQTPTSE